MSACHRRSEDGGGQRRTGRDSGEDVLSVASAVVEEAGRSSGCWLGDPCAALGCPGGCYSSDLGSTSNSLGRGRRVV